jgi:cytochrome c oxidase subunit 2
MKRKLLALMGMLLLATTVAAQETPSPPPAKEEPAKMPVREIKMTAKKYEFNPSEIRVRQGERVRLIIISLDRTHGIEIDAYGIKREIAEGDQTVVEFTADKPGTFQFKCAKWCGFGHSGMRGTLIVEPADTSAKEETPAGKE